MKIARKPDITLEVSTMDKEEILKRSREENKHGDELVTLKRIKRITVCILVVSFLILLIVNQYVVRDMPVLSALLDVITVLLACDCAITVYKFITTKDKSLLYDIALFVFLIGWHVIDIIKDIF